MTGKIKNLAVLGSTGSIGVSTLAVAKELRDVRIFGLSGHAKLERLMEQVKEHSPQVAVCTSQSTPASEGPSRIGEFGSDWNGRILWGSEGLVELATAPEVDIVVAAIVGQAGLESTLAATQAGKRVALANKEALVIAGDLVTKAAKDSGAELVPIDSEHSAIWQAAASGRREEIRRVILTASGGPFRNFDQQQLAAVTVSQALAHPIWDMGPKITVDSATMLNKTLEMIEAKWLFGLSPEQIEVVIHPQSIVHSMVEFVDGSVMAQLSPPDMKLPIQYALTYPARMPGPAPKMNWDSLFRLEFIPPNSLQRAALALGRQVCEVGGTSGAVLNAANEVAVQAFMDGKLSFLEIVPSCREILEQHQTIPNPTYEQLLAADCWARQEMNQWILA